MTNSKIAILPVLVLLLGFTTYHALSAQNPSDWSDKIDPQLLEHISARQAAGPIEFIIRLEEQATIELPSGLSKNEKNEAVYERLKNHAEHTQADIISALALHGAQFRPFFVTNAILVQGDGGLLETMAKRNDVAFLHANSSILVEQPPATDQNDQLVSREPQEIEWGVAQIDAPLVWAQGITGAGAIVAGQDTGYAWQHPALKSAYRGWNGTSADHNYNWHDAIHADLSGNNSNRCGLDVTEPCEDLSHGTHTMGTMIGADGANQIGVAPGANWIGCRNMEEGYGTPATYIECFEWFLAPRDLSNTNPNSALAPHVINNSWGCPESEGCNPTNFSLMNDVIENLRAAGIAVVVSAGNSGSLGCSSVSTPAAIFDGAFTVGATNVADQLASFSSKGPVSTDGSGRTKPNVVAPGVAINSADQTSGGAFIYSRKQGTSMAGPHVSGAIALMISAYPPIAGEVELLETYLEDTAEFIGIGGCGGDEIFNNTFGHGRINVNNAVNAIWNLDIDKTLNAARHTFDQENNVVSSLVTYTIGITKTGPGLTFTNVIIEDSLPANSTFVRANEVISQTAGGLNWEIDSLGPDGQVELEVSILVTGPITNSGLITIPNASASAKYVPKQTSEPLYVTVDTIWDLDIDKSLKSSRHVFDQANNSVSSLITYTIGITNAGPGITFTNLIMNDLFPENGTFISASEPVSQTSHGLSWAVGSLEPDGKVELEVTILVSNTITTSNNITLPSASASADYVPMQTSETLYVLVNIFYQKAYLPYLFR